MSVLIWTFFIFFLFSVFFCFLFFLCVLCVRFHNKYIATSYKITISQGNKHQVNIKLIQENDSFSHKSSESNDTHDKLHQRRQYQIISNITKWHSTNWARMWSLNGQWQITCCSVCITSQGHSLSSLGIRLHLPVSWPICAIIIEWRTQSIFSTCSCIGVHMNVRSKIWHNTKLGSNVITQWAMLPALARLSTNCFLFFKSSWKISPVLINCVRHLAPYNTTPARNQFVRLLSTNPFMQSLLILFSMFSQHVGSYIIINYRSVSYSQK